MASIDEPLDLIKLSVAERIYVKCRGDRELRGKRITHLRQYPTSIAAMDFNHDGSVLAIAASYTYEQGEKDHPNDAIFLHTVQDAEVRPKKKAAA
ncbi:Calcium-dependent protein kinase 5 [Phytophthora nicotianae]|uniref:Calcium-dependent protein kinase 5 n=1 Tax=Phytophthora nicotianae TaxID=4792 RepID=A0A0W8DG09_PHYNI|nr:Calcium-dependent protein kinase 5 [Phytophthora nicotianae]